MKRIVVFLIVGLLAYLLFLVARTPATVAYALIGERWPSSVALYDIEGTITEGTGRARLMDRINVDQVQWSFAPQGIVFGRLQYAVQLRGKQGELQGKLGLTVTGDRVVQDIEGVLSLRQILAAFAGVRAGLDGRVQTDLDEIRVQRDGTFAARGEVAFQGVAMGQDVPVGLGNFRASVDGEGFPLVVTVVGEQGPLLLNGQLNLQASGMFDLNAEVWPADESSELAELLVALGTPDANGRRMLSYTGQL